MEFCEINSEEHLRNCCISVPKLHFCDAFLFVVVPNNAPVLVLIRMTSFSVLCCCCSFISHANHSLSLLCRLLQTWSLTLFHEKQQKLVMSKMKCKMRTFSIVAPGSSHQCLCMHHQGCDRVKTLRKGFQLSIEAALKDSKIVHAQSSCSHLGSCSCRL